MKTAIAVYNNRIAPVFDVARRVIILESDTAPGARPTTVRLSGDQPLQKVRQLSALGAESLVCGAISQALQAALTAGGIRVIPFIAGDVQEVIDARSIQTAIEQNNYNRLATAKALGIHKTTLFRRMKRLGLALPEQDGRHHRRSLRLQGCNPMELLKC